MFNYTAQHILVMKLITQFEINTPALLHNFLFMVSAESLDFHDIGFYDFVRTKRGAFSPTLQSILEGLVLGQFLIRQPFSLSAKGRDTYLALASSLRPFNDYVDRCFSIYMKNKDELGRINVSLNNNMCYRRVKQGKKIFV